MTKKNVTRNALFTSIISLLLCVSMLVGTTFAWFTDEVKSGTNVIAAGNLDVELYHSNKTDAREIVTGTTNLFDEVSSKLWEPGALAYENFEVVNAGTLALKYKMNLMALEQSVVNGKKLGNVIKVGFKQGGFTSTTREGVIGEVSEWKTLTEFTLSKNGEKLTAGASDTFGLVLYWEPTDNDNDYNVKDEALNLKIGIELYATQVEAESDSFGIDYDILAVYPGTGLNVLPENAEAVEVPVKNEENQNVGAIVVPANAIEDPTKPVEVIYDESNYQGNFKVEDDEETLVVDVKVLNLKEDNTEPVKATLKIKAGLDPATVKLYHYDTEIPCTYNPNTGDVTFEVTSFSPFTVVYDAESEYVPPVIEEETTKPQAKVEESPEYVNTELPWGSYGAWSPTPGLEANLEAAYTFAVSETLEQAKQNPFANWYCDFYVKLDKDLGADQIFLGGNYGSFGWVGFHNGDLTLEANNEIPLLGSVTSNPWTYLDVVQNVGTFICGVGDVDDALTGATFTVMLRLTNPEDETEFYNVSTINYTFVDTKVYTAEALQTAVNAGGTVKLGSDIDMNGVRVTIPENTNVTIDLNGHTLTSKDGGGSNTMAVYVSRGANLTLNDSKGNGKIVASCYGVYILPGATFTMNGGELNVSGNGVYDIAVTTWNSAFVMNSGSINAKFAVWTSNYWKNNGESEAPLCNVTIAEGCEIESTDYADIDTVDAPDAVIDVPSTVTVYRGE